MKKDPNYIVKVEKAISDKYGKEAIINPKSGWDEEKEKKYLKELKEFYNRAESRERTTFKGGFTVKNRRAKSTTAHSRTCPVCSDYSMSFDDDLYMSKFACCFKCYIEYVEQREDRWASGWRPKK